VRLGAALASPLAVVLIVPGLVAAVGLFLTLLGQRALRDSTTQLGRDRFVEQTAFTARSIASSLAQADPMLDRLGELVASWSPDAPAEPVARALRGLLDGRAGVAYASVSYPDGTFRGAYLDEGVIRFAENRITESGPLMRRFDYTAGGLTPRSEERSGYDPRTRAFYRLAVESGRRVWTEPYLFYTSRQTGVTRTEPVFEPGPARRLRAVLTADFDIHALSLSMARVPIAGTKTLLYTNRGTLLAYPEGRPAVARAPLRGDRPLSLGDLMDPVVDAFAATARGHSPGSGRFEEFSANRQGMLAMVVAVPDFPELGWRVAAIVPEAAFFRSREVHERQSLIVASLSLLTALGVAVVFARHVVHVRREAESARDLARQATERARELGSYRLVERLGEGGMGEVWRAEHRLLIREAAIKLIHRDALSSSEQHPAELRERLRLEAQTLATLKSRHTIQLFDYGVTEEGTFFFVMELLDGMDLHRLVQLHGPQPVGRVIHLLVQACSSLGEAHEAGLVHRDIKPANIFVCRAADEVDIVKVLDFGLVQDAKRRSSSPGAPPALDAGALASGSADEPALPAERPITRAGQLMGTPAFMAPEQALGEETDGRADLYALGCVGWWLLTGHAPFQAATDLAMLLAHVHSPPPALPGPAEGSAQQLAAVLRQCLAKRRADRPADAYALARALNAIELPSDEVWTRERARECWVASIEPHSRPLAAPVPDRSVTVREIARAV
jgi:serine/threonine protein kinase